MNKKINTWFLKKPKPLFRLALITTVTQGAFMLLFFRLVLLKMLCCKLMFPMYCKPIMPINDLEDLRVNFGNLNQTCEKRGCKNDPGKKGYSGSGRWNAWMSGPRISGWWTRPRNSRRWPSWAIKVNRMNRCAQISRRAARDGEAHLSVRGGEFGMITMWLAKSG